jgi:folate-binding protein YgfZ
MTTSTAIRLTGRDTLDLLHRVTTNALIDLADGEARGTLFCDFRGRLLHRAVVARLADAVWLVRDDAPAAPLLAHLDRQIFREDVKVEDRSQSVFVSTMSGATVREGQVVAEGELPATIGVPGGPVLMVGAPRTLDPASAALERIADGRPAHGHEITDEFNPFEVNLAHEVHLDKGCYTGQEVLQRLVTYQSVRRRLMRVGGTGPAPSAPSDVNLAGERIGRLTSAVVNGDSWIGLAVLAWTAVTPQDLAIGTAALTQVEPLPLRRPIGRAWAAAG